MKRFALRCGLTLIVAAVAPLAALDAAASMLEKTIHVAGVHVRYKVVLPANYDPTRAYPAVLVMGGGPQTMESVDRALERYFRVEAERRGYIVVAPAASNDERFFEEGGRIFPEFLDEVLRQYRIVDGKFHAAGWSNGGISSLAVTAAHPDYFISVTAFPGYLWRPTDEKLLALSGICVFFYIGQYDQFPWHGEMRREAEFLRAHGTRATYTVENGQPHRIETLSGPNAARLFDGFEAAEQGCKLKRGEQANLASTVERSL